MSPVQRLPGELLGGGHRREQCLHRAGRAHVQTGQHPAWSALEHLDELRGFDQFGHELHGAGPGPYHRDPLASEVVVFIPRSAVDLVSLVGVDTADVGH